MANGGSESPSVHVLWARRWLSGKGVNSGVPSYTDRGHSMAHKQQPPSKLLPPPTPSPAAQDYRTLGQFPHGSLELKEVPKYHKIQYKMGLNCDTRVHSGARTHPDGQKPLPQPPLLLEAHSCLLEQ